MLSTHKNDHENACCSANQAGRKVRELIDTATHEARDATATAEQQIRSHPLAAGAIAAGVGFLIGALFRRR